MLPIVLLHQRQRQRQHQQDQGQRRYQHQYREEYTAQRAGEPHPPRAPPQHAAAAGAPRAPPGGNRGSDPRESWMTATIVERMRTAERLAEQASQVTCYSYM